MLKVKQIEVSDLPAVQPFSDRYIRRNHICVREDFFKWQYLEAAKVAGPDVPSGALMVVDGDEVLGLSLAMRAPIRLAGRPIVGAWHTDWFAAEKGFGAGLVLIKEQLSRSPFLGSAGQSLFAANVFGRMRPMCWFDLDRLFVCADPEATTAMLFSDDEVTPHLRYHQKEFLKYQRVAKPASSTSAATVTRFDDEYERVWAETAKAFMITTDRTAAYMNWRYVDHPVLKYDRLKVKTSRGTAYFIWREEEVKGHTSKVARICDTIGTPAALTEAFSSLYAAFRERKLAFADFFCSNADVNAALLAAGMRHVITLPDFDLPRLFSPLYRDVRKRLNYAYSIAPERIDFEFTAHHKTYFTKGDTNQDRPNP